MKEELTLEQLMEACCALASLEAAGNRVVLLEAILMNNGKVVYYATIGRGPEHEDPDFDSPNEALSHLFGVLRKCAKIRHERTTAVMDQVAKVEKLLKPG